MIDRVEQQIEVDAPRTAVFHLLATADGLRRWLDDAALEPRVGGEVRLTLRNAQTVGKVLAIDPPQHISFTWQWTTESGAVPTVVAFDAIDHGARTHVTVRHVGFTSSAQVDLHNELWRHWLARFADATRSLPEKVETTHP